MSTHTAAPWTFGVRRDGSIWLSLGDPKSGAHYQGDLCASEADAILITAAPDLLAALQRLMGGTTTLADAMEAATQARAAIAKATGGETP